MEVYLRVSFVDVWIHLSCDIILDEKYQNGKQRFVVSVALCDECTKYDYQKLPQVYYDDLPIESLIS